MKTRIISLLIALFLVLGAAMTSCAPKKKETQVAKYLNKILEATFSGLEDTELQVTTSKLSFKNTEDIRIPYIDGINATIITGKNGEMVSSAELLFGEDKVDLSIYNAGLTYIVGSGLLGNNKYGFELTDMGALMGIFSSLFIPAQPAPDATPVNEAFGATDSAASLGGLLGSLEGINSLLDGNNPEKVYGLIEKYANIFADAASGACKGKVETGDTVKVTVEFNTDSAKKFIKDVFASLKKDKDLKSIIEGVLVTSGMPKEEAAGMVDAYLSDEMARTIYDMLDASPFTFKAVVSADKDYILNGISVELKLDAVSYKVFFDSSEEGKAELGFTTSMSYEGTFSKQENKIVFENKTLDGAEIFEINTITVVDNNAYAERILRTEVKDGKYTLTVRIPDDVEGPYDMTIAGTVAAEGSKTALTVTSATAFGNTLAVDLTVETEIGGTLPAFPTDFKNILDVTGDELDEILDMLEESPLGQFMPQSDKGETELLPDGEGDILGGEEDGGVVLPDVE